MSTSILATRLADAAGLTHPVLVLQAPASTGVVARAIAEAASQRRVAWPPVAYTLLYAVSLAVSIAAGPGWAVGIFAAGAAVVYLASCAHRRRLVLAIDRAAVDLLTHIGEAPEVVHAAVPRSEPGWRAAGGWVVTSTPSRRSRHTAIAAATGEHHTSA